MWVYNGRKSPRRTTCGHKRSSKVRMLFHRQNGKCSICGRLMTYDLNQPNTATIDHIVPKSLGGSNGKKNLQAACGDCNNAKGSKIDGAIEVLVMGAQSFRIQQNPLIRKP